MLNLDAVKRSLYALLALAGLAVVSVYMLDCVRGSLCFLGALNGRDR